ncbi:MAG TPA: carboxymuconolactone decarboxylase family protein [Candidatus Bathyarchaeia archaeon]|uniref:carboxymuconolactone decarboxylase family protein n=1 Tax=Brevibacillus migulae TaxID=1644114 RepID=UPI00106E8762|nr:carboxymuconolactone decarboxylase family protein [Brevibacillus migulae]HZG13964.1 carboxymuconolactone decarboxylase family protein [Candidatus Bathyarchaeia archaeon]
MAEHQLSQEYREGLQAFGRVMPDVLSAYNQFTNLCFQEGELSRKQKHLMAMAVSLFTGNEHCIVYHLEGALDEKATEKEIAETIAVAGAYGGGTTFSHGVILINEVMDEFKQRVQ